MEEAGTGSEEEYRIDARGRMQWPKEKREAILAEFAKSRLSGQAFAKQAGIKYQTFAT
jgi:hypothetical protein